MCLQWCHVRRIVIDNDLPCALWCSDEIRLAQRERRCADCRHHQALPGSPRGLCLLTKELTPLSQTCCHHNAETGNVEQVTLRLGETVPPELLQAHGVRSVRDLFLVVDSAPELPAESPEDEIELDAFWLSLPLVYGVQARCWERALYGETVFDWDCETETT